MDLRKVLFIGGNVERLASVKIRCVDIAERLGCAVNLGSTCADQIPNDYSVFVCVKPGLNLGELNKLAKRGLLVWDIIDDAPPQQFISLYLASTNIVKRMYASYGPVELIPHHHCNFSGDPNMLVNLRPAWIGSRHWKPKRFGFSYDFYNSDGMKREDVFCAYRKIGIGLNLRKSKIKYDPLNQFKHKYELHVMMNSGIKLINCIGFGIPSISDEEPGYREIGGGCTIFSNLQNCSQNLNALQSSANLYHTIRENCIQQSWNFHIDTIADKYKTVLQKL